MGLCNKVDFISSWSSLVHGLKPWGEGGTGFQEAGIQQRGRQKDALFPSSLLLLLGVLTPMDAALSAVPTGQKKNQSHTIWIKTRDLE